MIALDIEESEEHLSELATLMDWCLEKPDECTYLQYTTGLPAVPPPQEELKLKEISHYGKKRDCVLPTSFFDIQSNIQLLNKCNPLSIRVVDCDKHPWYYKKFNERLTQSITEHNEDSTELWNETFVKLSSVGTVKCIDLTQTTDDELTKESNNNIRILITNNNIMPQTNAVKRISHGLPHRIISREDIEKDRACSQVNFSKIDLKHNTGLVGLKITSKEGFDPVLFNKKKKKRKNKKPINVKETKTDLPMNKEQSKGALRLSVESNKADKCYLEASKVLELFGTQIVPVTYKDKIQNVTDCPLNASQLKLSVHPSAKISVSKSVETKDKKMNSNQMTFNNSLLKATLLKPIPILATENCNVNKTVSTQEPGLIQKLDENMSTKQETVAEKTAKANSPWEKAHVDNKGISEPTSLPNEANVEIISVQNIIDGTITRSKSPIFPCNNNKQRTICELEKHLRKKESNVPLIEKTKSLKTANDVDSAKRHEKGIFVKNWPKSASEFKNKNSSAPNPNLGNENNNNNTNVNLNVLQAQQHNALKTNTENKNTEKYSKLEKQVIAIKAMTTLGHVTTTKNLPKLPILHQQTPVSSLHTNRTSLIDHRHEVKKDTAKAGPSIFINNNKSQNENVTSNVSNSQKAGRTNVFDKHLDTLIKKHFAIKTLKTNLENKLKAPLPSKGLLVQTVAPNVSLPSQTPGTNRQDLNVYPGNIPSVVSTQDVDASLPKPRPAHPPGYCRVNGESNKFAQQPSCWSSNEHGCAFNIGNTNMYFQGTWDPRVHFPIPPFMYPPPLFLPPPPLPASSEELQTIINSLKGMYNSNEKVVTNEVNSNNTNVDSTCDINKTIRDPKSTISGSVVNLNVPNVSPGIETKITEQIAAPTGYNLSITAIKPTSMAAQQNKSARSDKSSNESVQSKEETNINPNELPIYGGITITPVTTSTPNDSSHAATKISVITKNPENKRINRSLDKKTNINVSFLQVENYNEPTINKNETKAGPLCMKNRTGPFAVNNASKLELKLTETTGPSQPSKGYSPPILPIPTWQTLIAQKQALELKMRIKANEKPVIKPVANIHLYSAAQNRIQNNNNGDKGSRKRLHFEENNAAVEVKPVKKITLEDYKNRSFSAPNDTFGVIGRKFPRKSHYSTKSVSSLADVVNRNVEHEV